MALAGKAPCHRRGVSVGALGWLIVGLVIVFLVVVVFVVVRRRRRGGGVFATKAKP